MTMTNVTIVRVYLTEAEKTLKPIWRYLHDEAHVRGVTVFRGIEGFGKSGHVYSASLVDLLPDLPLVVEFFDIPERVNTMLEQIYKIIESDHVICWNATVALNSK